jgi:hypothetical protein
MLMAVEIRVFLPMDAIPEISGMAIAAGSNSFSFHGRQSLDSKRKAFGIAPMRVSPIGHDGMLPLRETRFLAAKNARILDAANRAQHAQSDAYRRGP